MSGWSLERREKQREVAKRLVEEGKFGGKGRGQGRPRNKRASEVVAEKTSAEGEAIFDRMMEIVRGGKNQESIAAARTLLETEEKERKLQLEEEANIEDMHRNDLLALVGSLLQDTGFYDIDEAEFEPVEQRAVEGASEESEPTEG
jgi:hypothetical protein